MGAAGVLLLCQLTRYCAPQHTLLTEAYDGLYENAINRRHCCIAAAVSVTGGRGCHAKHIHDWQAGQPHWAGAWRGRPINGDKQLPAQLLPANIKEHGTW